MPSGSGQCLVERRAGRLDRVAPRRAHVHGPRTLQIDADVADAVNAISAMPGECATG